MRLGISINNEIKTGRWRNTAKEALNHALSHLHEHTSPYSKVKENPNKSNTLYNQSTLSKQIDRLFPHIEAPKPLYLLLRAKDGQKLDDVHWAYLVSLL